jgi:hypothetical protein
MRRFKIQDSRFGEGEWKAPREGIPKSPGGFMEPLTFVNIQWVKPLAEKLKDLRGRRAEEVQTLNNDC